MNDGHVNSSDTNNREPTITIIGAGVAGIATAYELRQAGFANITIIEKAPGVGGVWHWNQYPGLACDVPSQLYQFAFAPNPQWDRIWATGPEIRRYHQAVVDDLELTHHIRLNTEITSATYDDASHNWTLTTSHGEVLHTDILICATGVLQNPAYPNIPGLESFVGPVVHTARWDHALATADKRIAVIGTGSTGVQIVSALQPSARSLTHFVRTPQWVLWAPMSIRQPRWVAAIFRRFPGLHRRAYRIFLSASDILADIVTTPSWRRRAVQAYARLSLRVQVRDRRLRARLTPDYEPLCKRQVVSGTYYRAIQRPNADLVDSAIVSADRTGIVTADGHHHDVDIIVLATGFRAHDYMRPMAITGRAGITLDDAWKDGPRAYRMTALPGFPNLFTVLGPNSPTGSISLQHSAQLTGRYIAHWLQRFRTGEIAAIEVTEEATEAFNAQVSRAVGPTVWNTGCNSWYFTAAGTIDLWPFRRSTLEEMLDSPDDTHFTLVRRTDVGARPAGDRHPE